MKDLVKTLKLDEKGPLTLEKKTSNRGYKQDYDSEIEKKNMFSHVPLPTPNKNKDRNSRYKENKLLLDFTDESYNDEKYNGHNENAKHKDRNGQVDQGSNMINENEKAQLQQSEASPNSRPSRLINYDSKTNNKELETDSKEKATVGSKYQNQPIQKIDEIKKTFDKLDEKDKNLLRKFIIQESLSPTKGDNSDSLLGEFQVKPLLQEKISPLSNKQEEVIGLQKKYLNASPIPIKIEENSLNKSDLFEDKKQNNKNNNDIDVEEYENDFELSESALGDSKRLGESGLNYKTSHGDNKLFNSKYLENLNNYISNTKPNSLDVDLSKFK